MNTMSKRMKDFYGKNILAIDYGTKAIGLATFTPGKDPFPLPFGRIKRDDDQKVIKELKNIISTEDINIIVLGLPKFLDGKESRMTGIVKQFGQLIIERFKDQKFFYQEEALSTKEAEDRMKNSPQYNFKVNLKQIDAVAASIILEDFINDQ